jgi:glycosyltransferase involved in cell wall biosynthesis
MSHHHVQPVGQVPRAHVFFMGGPSHIPVIAVFSGVTSQNCSHRFSQKRHSLRVLLDCSRISTGGGIQGSLAVLHNAVATLEHEWHVVMSAELSAEFPRELDAGLKSVTRLGQWTSLRRKIASPLFMTWHERAIRPDIVFSVFGPVYWRPRATHLVGFAIPHLIYPETVVLQDYGHFGRFFAQLVLRLGLRSFRQADYLVVETDTVRDRLESVLGIPRRRVFVVRNTYSPLFEASLKQTPPKEAGGPFVIFVPSAAYPHKNLRCIPHVSRDLELMGHKNFEFVLTLPKESSSWRALQKASERLNVRHRLRTVGNVPHGQLGAHYRQADGVFLPTLLECSTAVYPESFIARVPVVTSKLDFAMELCGEAAIYIDPFSSTEAATALARLMSNPNLRAQVIEAGRRQLCSNYVSQEEKWRLQLNCMQMVRTDTSVPSRK